MCSFGRGHYVEHFHENVMNLDQWLRCHLKILLFLALVAILFREAELFV